MSEKLTSSILFKFGVNGVIIISDCLIKNIYEFYPEEYNSETMIDTLVSSILIFPTEVGSSGRLIS